MRDTFIHMTGGECYFSMNLRRLRLLREPRLSQERLAQRLGICRATYAKYEQGRRMPPAWFAFSTANYFGVAVEDLFCKPSEMHQKEQEGGEYGERIASAKVQNR